MGSDGQQNTPSLGITTPHSTSTRNCKLLSLLFAAATRQPPVPLYESQLAADDRPLREMDGALSRGIEVCSPTPSPCCFRINGP